MELCCTSYKSAICQLCDRLPVHLHVYSGVRIPCGERGSVQGFPYMENDPCGPPRSHQMTCEAAEIAVRENTIVGVGPSCTGLLFYHTTYFSLL